MTHLKKIMMLVVTFLRGYKYEVLVPQGVKC